MDWRAWHLKYGDPAWPLSRRLAIVQALLRDTLLSRPPGPIALTSACAGDGRDVRGVLAQHPRAADVTAVLVEKDPELAATAGARVGDAGELSTYREVPRADVLLLCGVFGNVSDEDVQNTVDNASRLCAAGATVIWTRHRREPDLTPAVRSWWAQAGWEETAFVSGAPTAEWSVGAAVLTRDALPYKDMRLFTFTSL
ncbi:MAG: SAM-dependent methyltransferase [Mycobacteriales bacterium]